MTFTDRLLAASPDLAEYVASQQHITAPNPGSDEAYDAGCTCDRESNRDGEGLSWWELQGLTLYDIDDGCPLHAAEVGE